MISLLYWTKHCISLQLGPFHNVLRSLQLSIFHHILLHVFHYVPHISWRLANILLSRVRFAMFFSQTRKNGIHFALRHNRPASIHLGQKVSCKRGVVSVAKMSVALKKAISRHVHLVLPCSILAGILAENVCGISARNYSPIASHVKIKDRIPCCCGRLV